MIEVRIEEVLGRRGTSFAFQHQGRKAFCFLTAGSDSLPKLSPGMRVVVDGRWSPAGQKIYEAQALTVLSP